MKKMLFPILILTFIVSIVFAGPFGLSKGMSVSAISKLSKQGFEPERISDDDKYFFIPKKPHDLFKAYIAYVDDRKGLYRINAVSNGIESSVYGLELRIAFNVLVHTLSKTYGTPKRTDKIKENYKFKEGKYWLRSLKDGARELSATWKRGENGTTLPQELDKISVYLSANFLYGLINIDYSFSNSAEIEKKQVDVL